MEKYLCIHGHFYQPPRENPWLEEIELQDSAYPYHDWNERINTECYAPNSAARILDHENTIIDIVNNYSKIHFDFGPTLLSWMERRQPEVYQAILDADRESAKRYSGHGSAMAQVYNHMIMPLASRRDKITQARWGIKDFMRRFGRFPEGMWLPETAVDIETLEVMAELGIRYTILAPHQIRKIRRLKERDTKWEEVREGEIDTTIPYLCRLPSGKGINLFIYNGPLSREAAFGDLLNNGEHFAARLSAAFSEKESRSQMVHLATDGETFGHHHPHADMALAYALYTVETRNMARLTNYGEYLSKCPPVFQAEIVENTSWSCAHGIERWRSNCGCNIGAFPGGKQPWRAPLRKGMDWLRDRAAAVYEDAASAYLRDPWKAREDYIDVVGNRSRPEIERFFRRHGLKPLDPREKTRALKLLEMQRNAMLMFTSCGWFFDDISGIESVQIMQYACRVIQLAEETGGDSLEPGFLEFLRGAPSLLEGNGASIYEKFVKPFRVDLLRVGAHHAILSLFDSNPEASRIYCYTIVDKEIEQMSSGRLKLIIGKSRLISDLTWEEETVGFAVLDLGDHNITGGICPLLGLERFSAIRGEIEVAFERGNVPEVSRLLHQYFGSYSYSVSSLFRDEQRKILRQILKLSYDGISAAYGQMHENHYSLMNFFKSLEISLPKPLLLATEYVINTALQDALEKEDTDLVQLEALVQEAKKWPVNFDKPELEHLVSARLEEVLRKFLLKPEEAYLLEFIEKMNTILAPLQLDPKLWKSQNLYFSIAKDLGADMERRAKEGNVEATRWMKSFRQVGAILRVKTV